MTVPATRPDDPAELGFPPMLPIELALRSAPVEDTCRAYGIGRDDWDRLKVDPVFLIALKEAVDTLKKDGMTFKMKARLQAEELLKKSWDIIHSPGDVVPAAVKADLIKFTIKAAGLDASKEQAAAAAGAGLTINLQFNNQNRVG